MATASPLPADSVREALVFLPRDPPRAGRFAVWSLDDHVEAPLGRDGHPLPSHPLALEVALPRGRTVAATGVSALEIKLVDAIDWLATLQGDATTPVTRLAWSQVVRMGLALIARGRIVPGISMAGVDAWRMGPLDPEDKAMLSELAAALPPAAHAVVLADAPAADGKRRPPTAVLDPQWVVGACLDAVADAFVRTAAAPAIVTSPAYAARRPSDVSKTPDWLAAVDRSLAAGARPVLRLDLPHNDDPTPAGDGVADLDLDISATLLLRSNADPSLMVQAEDLWDAPDAVLARLGDDAETDLLLALRRGASVWPPLRRALDDARPSTIELSADEADDLLGPVADELGGAGFEVLWPSGLLKASLTLTAKATTPDPGSVASSGITLDSLLDFRWRALLDGTELTEAELAVLADAKRPLVRLRGRWIAADPQLLQRLRQRRQVRAADLLANAINGTIVVDGQPVELEVDGPLADLAARLRDIDPTHELAEPIGLEAELRPYQRRGLAWLDQMTELGLGGCLADDMGLGKTIQLIALHLHRHRPEIDLAAQRPTLVVCPATLLGNWEREVQRFAPGLPVRRYHGGSRHLDDLAPAEIVVATYGLIRRDRAVLAEIEWGLVVADEAQHVKNPLARTARELRRVPAQARLALTGTPVENRLTELWALLDWTTPGLLGSLDAFKASVAVPVERNHDPEATERFAQQVRPFLLRRKKSDPNIAPDLPPKTETDVIVPLTAEQLSLYESCAQDTLALIEKADGIARQGLIFKLFTGLKQITNHPAHFLKESGPLAGRSGKLEAFDELTGVIVDEGESVLVFTQYVQMGKLLERHLTDRGIDSFFLSGRRAGRQAPRHGGPLPGRRGAGDGPVVESGRHRPESDSGHPRHPLRPLVEPGGRGPGDGPGLPHRPGQVGAGVSAAVGGHDRGSHRRPARTQAPVGRRGDRRRRGVVEPALRRRAARTGGVRVMARRRGFGATWWGQAWVDAIEQRAHLDPNRLPRGRTYARQSRVGPLRIEAGVVRARVAGDRPTPYSVQLTVRPFTDEEWDRALDVIAGRAAHAAALLDGELDPGIVADAAAVGVDLLPVAGEVVTRCSCPDWANPCKHAAAVCYLVADLMDQDPFTILLLRGRDRAGVLAGVRARRRSARREPGRATTKGRDDHALGPRVAQRDIPIGIDARQVWKGAGDQQRDRLLARPPLAVPRHAGPPAALGLDPPESSGLNRIDLGALASDAAQRALAVLADDASSGLELTRTQDLARRAADAIAASAFDDLARRSGTPAPTLLAHAVGWRHGGAEGVDVTDTTWTPSPEQLAPGRSALVESGVTPRVRDNRLSAGLFQLRLGRSGQWYRFERRQGSWELAAPPDRDPAELLVSSD